MTWDGRHDLGYKHKCDCGRSYKQLHTLRRHKKYECGTVPAFRCPFCGSMHKHRFDMNKHIKNAYLAKSTLRRHLKLECGKNPTHECRICGLFFKHKHRLVSHLKSWHLPEDSKNALPFE
ncbi:unnamed protein product [Phyllotreta striolata]|uniref:C2H2-type domain-containing protein n=1 Tax=Phyllotreta striolata TaxID=444603 RepID=A0A9N9TTZ6_PHYSR|nr:unnamed protein product [Phyllotreta striolata]